MKKVILAAVLAGIGSTAAWAADVGAPVEPVPTQVYNWTGFYFGGDAGVAGVTQNSTSNFSQPVLSLDPFFDPSLANNIQGNSLSNTPFVGGGHVGFNWQFAPSLGAGVEGDWQSVRARSSFCRQTNTLTNGCSDGSNEFGTVSSELDWVATARGRLGWAVGSWMLYGTAGAAFADIKTSVSLNCPFNCGVDFGGARPVSALVSSSTHKMGWVAGAGVEWMFAENWIVRGEYQHIDLGSVSSALTPADCICTLSSTQKLNLDIIRGGISFKFGG